MKRSPVPTPAEYIQEVLDGVKCDMIKDQTNVARELARKVLGFKVDSFGDVQVSEFRTKETIQKLDQELLKSIEDKLVESVTAELPKNITKTFIRDLTDRVLNKIYDRVEERIFDTISNYIEDAVSAKIKEDLAPWLVAAEFTCEQVSEFNDETSYSITKEIK
jgi:uncharacterized membrane protein YheB (UPF0754 family)